MRPYIVKNYDFDKIIVETAVYDSMRFYSVFILVNEFLITQS